jgi:putative endonuclease
MKQKYSPTRRFGNKAEDLAIVFLINTGHKIICRNFLRKVGEIDIITTKNNIFHFIEVKGTVKSNPGSSYNYVDDFRVENRVNQGKIHKIYKTANIFLMEQEIVGAEFQIDLITVTFYKSDEVPRLDMIENIN